MPLWRRFDRGSKLWLDEPEPCGYAKHEALLIEEARTVDARASSTLPRGEMVTAGNHHHRLTTTCRRLINPRNESPGGLGDRASELALMARPGEDRGIAYPARPEIAHCGRPKLNQEHRVLCAG